MFIIYHCTINQQYYYTILAPSSERVNNNNNNKNQIKIPLPQNLKSIASFFKKKKKSWPPRELILGRITGGWLYTDRHEDCVRKWRAQGPALPRVPSFSFFFFFSSHSLPKSFARPSSNPSSSRCRTFDRHIREIGRRQHGRARLAWLDDD